MEALDFLACSRATRASRAASCMHAGRGQGVKAQGRSSPASRRGRGSSPPSTNPTYNDHACRLPTNVPCPAHLGLMALLILVRGALCPPLLVPPLLRTSGSRTILTPTPASLHPRCSPREQGCYLHPAPVPSAGWLAPVSPAPPSPSTMRPHLALGRGALVLVLSALHLHLLHLLQPPLHTSGERQRVGGVLPSCSRDAPRQQCKQASPHNQSLPDLRGRCK